MENTKMNYESPIAEFGALNTEDVVLASLPGYEWGELGVKEEPADW